MREYLCKGCGASFFSGKGSSSYTPKFCSRKCFLNSTRTTTRCKRCQVEFRHKPPEKRKYCSELCFSAGKVQVTCARCGKEVWKKLAHTRFVESFCSVECRKSRKLAACLNCFREFAVIPSRVAKFCRMSCRRAFQRNQKLLDKFPCSACGEIKSRDRFYVTKKGVVHRKCWDCKNADQRRKARQTPGFRLKANMYRAIHRSITQGTRSKLLSYLPYNTEDLIRHLESKFEDGMTWENYGRGGWHVDHIRPQSQFSYTAVSDEGFQECWALHNLQPMWEEDNISKSDAWEE